jgi:tripartite-type tricarboxylate transporter receptor subunit TctC
MGGELFRAAAGVQVLHVPYRGAGPAMQDLLAGQINFMVDGVSTVAPHARAGTLRALAIAAAQRSAVLPEVPTAAEAGLPGFEAATWNVVLAPVRTPPATIEVLHRAFLGGIRASRQRLQELGMEIDPGKSPSETTAFVRAEVEKWGPIVRASGARVE